MNTISPGFIETAAATRLMERLADQRGIDADAARQELMQSFGGIPIGRRGMPQEIAELADLLSSERGTSIRGSDYRVDGGAIPTI